MLCFVLLCVALHVLRFGASGCLFIVSHAALMWSCCSSSALFRGVRCHALLVLVVRVDCVVSVVRGAVR